MKDTPERPISINDLNHRVARAWEEFTDTGQLQPAAIRTVIRQSWEKSRNLGIPHDTSRAPTVITADELQARLRTEDLTLAGTTALNRLTDLLNDTEHVVVLADQQGHILYSIGHHQIRDRLENINFMPGGAWAETVVGPNGVGTPLELGRPEMIMGHEHYCQGWQPWVCYGAPIFDPSGKHIKGAIDITGPVERVNRESMALAISVAQSIQSGLSVIQYRRRDELREEARHFFQRWSADGVVVLDEFGHIADYNNHAAKILKLENLHLVDQSMATLIPGIAKTLAECFDNRFSAELELQTPERQFSCERLKLRIKPVLYQNRCIGTVMILSDASEPIRKPPRARTSESAHRARFGFDDLQGDSVSMQRAVNLARACAADPMQNNVLLIGETGTGKELMAHSIHAASQRAEHPFVALNCAAIPRDLIESELFGYCHGAFTGARRDGMKGKFELAHGGTLFLDEINSMQVELQAKLLRVLDSMEVTPIGSSSPIQVDVRVIAAANNDIHMAVAEERFRSDLFHRISVLEIDIPKLSERDEDIISMAESFLERECARQQREALRLDAAVRRQMLAYTWPGNVRELHNLCMRWALTVTGQCITMQDLPAKLQQLMKPVTDAAGGSHLQALSDELIRSTLEQTSNNISRAARILGIDRSTIYRRSRRWTGDSQ